MKRLLIAAAALLSLQSAASAQLSGPSRWTNQSGSELRITTTGRGTFRGTFINRNPAIGCLGISYPVAGTTFSTQIAFTVNFVKCRSTVKWRGNVQGFGMSVPWGLTTANQPSLTGFDFFGRS